MKEKRLLTILYADLAGFTQLTSKLGPEKTADFINECFNTIDAIIHSHDGTIIRHEGDRVMAAFGFPKSKGYDSYSAVLSALKIKDEIKTFSYPVEVHIGIATGEAVCDANQIYGYVINTASQFEENAPAGDIYLDKNCYKINKRFFEFERMSEYKDEVYKLISEKKICCEYKNKFVNREKELKTLINYINRSEKIIIVAGPEGIGKTRFTQEAIIAINKPEGKFNLFQTSFLSTQKFQFYEPILKLIAELKPDYRIKTDINLLSETSYNIARYDKFSKIIFAAGQIKPLIILFQYTERIDENSLAFLKFLINSIQHQNIVLIFEMHRLPKFIMDEIKSITQAKIPIIELPPLSKKDQLKIALELFGDTEVPNKTIEEIIQHTGGNPLFLLEICHDVKNQCISGKPPGEITIPYQIKEVLNHLLDQIPVDVLSTLSIGALYNYSFDKEFIKHAANNADETIACATEHGIISVNNNEVSFNSPFIRDEIINRMSKSLCIEIHQKIASILSQISTDHDKDKKLAYHFNECGNYELALHYAIKWAKKLKDIHSNEQALESYNNAHQISKKIGDRAEYKILLERIDTLHLLGKREEEKADIDRLQELVKNKGSEQLNLDIILRKGQYLESISDYNAATRLYEDYRKRFDDLRILERLGACYYNKSKFQKSLAVLNEALKIASKHKDIKKEGDIQRQLSLTYLKTGEKQKSLDCAHRAIKLFDKIADAKSMANATANLGTIYYWLNQFQQSLDYFNTALKVAEEFGDVAFRLRMLANIGGIYFIMGEYNKALKNYEAALKITKDTIDKRWESIVLNNIGNIYGSVGKFKDAISFFEQALALSEAIGDTGGIAIRCGNIGDGYAYLNQLTMAKKYLQRAYDISVELNITDWISYYKNELANILIINNQFKDALQLAGDAIKLARRAKNISYVINGLSTEALCCLKMGDIKKALKYSKSAVREMEKAGTIEGVKSNIYYTHYKILIANKKIIEAYEYIEKAYHDIKEKGDHISNEDLRKSFFYNRKDNREIIEEWKSISNK